MEILTKNKVYRINRQIAREVIETFIGIPLNSSNISRLACFITELELEPENIHPLTQKALERGSR